MNKTKKPVEEYEKKELRQHIYDTPDTYAGGCDLITETLPIYNQNAGSISFKEIEYIPVIYNMFIVCLTRIKETRVAKYWKLV